MSRVFAVLSLLVGLGMFFGSAWLAVDVGLDAAAFPAAPKAMTLAELAGLRRVPRGTWVRLVGPFEVEAKPVQPNAGGPYYVLLRDPQRTAHLVVTGEVPSELGRPWRPESSQPAWTGVPTVHRTHGSEPSYRDLPRSLAFDGVDWSGPSDPPLVILWTHSGPRNSRIGLVIAPLLALVGLGVAVFALGNLRRRPETMDAMWTGDDLPQSVRLGRQAGRKLRIYAWILLGFGVAWLGGFGYLEGVRGHLGPSSLHLLAVGMVLVLLGAILWVRARRVSGHEYFAALVWLPVRKSQAVRSEGIATGVTAYELEMPAGTKPNVVTAHSSGLHGGLVFRDASRAEVLAARPLHSSDVIVLSSSLEEIRENPLAPLAHPRHRLKRLA